MTHSHQHRRHALPGRILPRVGRRDARRCQLLRREADAARAAVGEGLEGVPSPREPELVHRGKRREGGRGRPGRGAARGVAPLPDPALYHVVDLEIATLAPLDPTILGEELVLVGMYPLDDMLRMHLHFRVNGIRRRAVGFVREGEEGVVLPVARPLPLPPNSVELTQKRYLELIPAVQVFQSVLRLSDALQPRILLVVRHLGAAHRRGTQPQLSDDDCIGIYIQIQLVIQREQAVVDEGGLPHVTRPFSIHLFIDVDDHIVPWYRAVPRIQQRQAHVVEAVHGLLDVLRQSLAEPHLSVALVSVT